MNTTPLAHQPLPSRKQQAANLILSMQDCLEANKDGGYNREAFDRMQELVSSLRYIGGPFGEKPGGLAGLAEQFWNPRRGSRSTVDTNNNLRQSILQHLTSLKMLNSQMQD